MYMFHSELFQKIRRINILLNAVNAARVLFKHLRPKKYITADIKTIQVNFFKTSVTRRTFFYTY